ncbi:MAG: hypothetical protein JXA52_08020, partial [Planctomycetes bacterium]|nr:hypothetical protein [Planctomycetota bacterium]
EYGLDAIAPGDYAATIYYLDNLSGDPAGQFEVTFSIKVGETTRLTLDEKDMLPYREPEINMP